MQTGFFHSTSGSAAITFDGRFDCFMIICRALIVLFILLGLSASAQMNTPADAIALEQQGKLPEAEQAWRRFLKQHPRDASAYASLGVVASKQQKYADAVQAYRKALELNPKIPGIRLNLGLAEFKQGHFHAAITPLKA